MARSSAGLGILALVVLSACAPAEPAVPAGLSDADRAAIQQTTDEFVQAVRSSDFAAAAALYTADAVVMPPNAPPVTGPAGVQAFLATFPTLTEFNITVDHVDGYADLAYVHGTYALTMMLPDSTTLVDSGKYLDVRRRQADGRWLYSFDIFNSNVPLPGAEAPATSPTP
jgi:ketosteroid isomerase-like protein